jgi:hypothetical protein
MDSLEQEFSNCLHFQSSLLHLLQHLNEAERHGTDLTEEPVKIPRADRSANRENQI